MDNSHLCRGGYKGWRRRKRVTRVHRDKRSQTTGNLSLDRSNALDMILPDSASAVRQADGMSSRIITLEDSNLHQGSGLVCLHTNVIPLYITSSSSLHSSRWPKCKEAAGKQEEAICCRESQPGLYRARSGAAKMRALK